MRITVLLFFVCLLASAQDQKLTVTGKLTRAMAIGGESTGWSIKLEAAVSIGNKQVDTLEIQDPKTKRLAALENKRVEAVGKISHRRGVETGDRPFLIVSSLKELQAAFQLTGSEWLLENHPKATLAFPESGKVAGNGSCNRFFGTVEVHANAIQFGPLGSTRMACPEAVMKQESTYLDALQKAEHFDWKDPYLVIYSKGFERPLRFTRK